MRRERALSPPARPARRTARRELPGLRPNPHRCSGKLPVPHHPAGGLPGPGAPTSISRFTGRGFQPLITQMYVQGAPRECLRRPPQPDRKPGPPGRASSFLSSRTPIFPDSRSRASTSFWGVSRPRPPVADSGGMDADAVPDIQFDEENTVRFNTPAAAVRHTGPAPARSTPRRGSPGDGGNAGEVQACPGSPPPPRPRVRSGRGGAGSPGGCGRPPRSRVPGSARGG